jgi:hypothetical protein
LNLAEVQELKRSSTPDDRLHVWVRRRIDILPDLLYSWDMERYTAEDKPLPESVEEVVKRERVGQTGMSASKRNQFIEEMMR